MKPAHQRRLRAGDGDCFEACLATVLEAPIWMVPDFHRICDEHEPGFTTLQRMRFAEGEEFGDYPDGAWEDYLERRRKWLRALGLSIVEIDVDGADEPLLPTSTWWEVVDYHGPDFLWIATTRVDPRYCHATVWRDRQPVWNPTPGHPLDPKVLGELVTATYLVLVDVSRTRILHAISSAA